MISKHTHLMMTATIIIIAEVLGSTTFHILKMETSFRKIKVMFFIILYIRIYKTADVIRILKYKLSKIIFNIIVELLLGQ